MAARPGPPRSRLRGGGNFSRLDGVMDTLERWFFASDALAEAVDSFVVPRVEAFVADAYGEDVDAATGVHRKGWRVWKYTDAAMSVSQQNAAAAALLAAREVHGKFEALFEAALAEQLCEAGLSEEEFLSLHRISAQDEGEKGVGFHRFLDVVGFEEFARLMHAWWATHSAHGCPASAVAAAAATSPSFAPRRGGGEVRIMTCCGAALSCADLLHAAAAGGGGWAPSDLLRARAAALAAEAKDERRRRREVLPLIDEWDVATFKELVGFLHGPGTPCPQPATAPVPQRKALVAFRQRLLVPALDTRTGVYMDPPVPAEDMARYVTAYARCLTRDEYSAFHDCLRRKVADVAAEATAEAAARRAVWRAFHALDVDYARCVPVQFVRCIVESDPAYQAKSWKKALTRAVSLAEQRAAEAAPSFDLAAFRVLVAGLEACDPAGRTCMQLAHDLEGAADDLDRRGRLKTPPADIGRLTGGL
eukprot:TRINITY_DN21011_c0_g1_i1.p1 TRINITY_DN21011_c0_g1~~TRINITY_DN21011_c0_g1_i1.p1  ORF type:complete len:477 (+),score=129.54 TRINITY_DN21011_c0_g1_i1:74-1504(+)